MARPLRIDRAGEWYHVMSRGIERRDIFLDDQDRGRWLEGFAQVREAFGWVAHGYILMSNHYHLLIETRAANLSEGMQWLNSHYAGWFNRRHERVGPLFQGRFRAVMVDRIGAGLEVSRYVHLNPVRVMSLGLGKQEQAALKKGLKGQPAKEEIQRRLERLRQYRWSSYRAYAGYAGKPDWLEIESVLGLMGQGEPGEQQLAYRGYVREAVREGLVENPLERVVEQVLIGRTQWVERMAKWLHGGREQKRRRELGRVSWGQIVEVVDRLKGERWEEYAQRHGDWGRELAMYLGRRWGRMKLREIGRAVGGTDYAAVSAAVVRFGRRLPREPFLEKQLAAATRELNIEC